MDKSQLFWILVNLITAVFSPAENAEVSVTEYFPYMQNGYFSLFIEQSTRRGHDLVLGM